MSKNIYDELERTLKSEGANAALGRLCANLKKDGDYDNLFFARVMAKRYQLGLSPVPTLLTQNATEEQLDELEDTIRTACREVGGLYLDQGQIPQAWPYFRMIGETEPIADALRAAEPAEDDESVEDLIQIALTEGVLPRRGFDWVIERYGICSAITTLGSQQVPNEPGVKQYCIGAAMWALYGELRERLAAAIEEHEGEMPAEVNAPLRQLGVVRKLMTSRNYLFDDSAYHIDLSHLSSVVQMSIDLPPGEELELARELCEYGASLSADYGMSPEPPFDEQYKDYGIYLAALAGENVEGAVAHFRKKVDDNPVEEAGSAPAMVLVQMLMRLGRRADAAKVASEKLSGVDDARLSWVASVCEEANAYGTLAEAARKKQNPVQFMAGLLGQ